MAVNAIVKIPVHAILRCNLFLPMKGRVQFPYWNRDGASPQRGIALPLPSFHCYNLALLASKAFQLSGLQSRQHLSFLAP